MRRILVVGTMTVALVAAMATPSQAAVNDRYRARQWGLDTIQAEKAWTVNAARAMGAA